MCIVGWNRIKMSWSMRFWGASATCFRIGKVVVLSFFKLFVLKINSCTFCSVVQKWELKIFQLCHMTKCLACINFLHFPGKGNEETNSADLYHDEIPSLACIHVHVHTYDQPLSPPPSLSLLLSFFLSPSITFPSSPES